MKYEGIGPLNAADIVLKEIEKMTEKQFLPIVGPEKGKVLTDVVNELKPKSVLEVGTLIGYSTILIGKELKKDVELITIEIHSDEAKIAQENIRKADIPPTVRVRVGDALKILPRLKKQFDLAFIDAAKEEYIDYLRLIENRLHKGSIVVADNAGIFARQMRYYLDYVRSSGKYRSRYVPAGGDGLEISVKL